MIIIIFKIILGIMAGVLMIDLLNFLIVITHNIVHKNYLIDKNLMKMSELYDIYKRMLKVRGRTYKVKDFDIYANVFSFKNIGTSINKEGNCFGLIYLIKGIFNDEIPKRIVKNGKEIYDITFINKNLNEYKITNEIAQLVYDDIDNCTKEIECTEISCDKATFLYHENLMELLEPEEIYKRFFDDDSEMLTQYKMNDENNNISEILKAIEYYQNEIDNHKSKFKISFSYRQIFRNKIDVKDYFYATLQLVLNRNIKFRSVKYIKDQIINKIDNHKLVVVLINSMKFGGHAILAYKYEIIDEDIVKIYIYDCNMPLFDENSELNTAINKDIINNTYILFVKVKGKWQYIYCPIINGNYIYEGKYNSYVPDTELGIVTD